MPCPADSCALERHRFRVSDQQENAQGVFEVKRPALASGATHKVEVASLDRAV